MPVLMMPVQDDYKFCANCFMHNWDQPEDKSSLEHCPKCRLILYCGKACRKEHWEKVHKNHCQFLADPSQCPESQHDAETCAICRPAAGTGKGKRKMAGGGKKRNPASSSYECFLKDVNFAPSIASPHPFPLAGVGDDQLEKLIIILQKLVHKLNQNPRVVRACSAELDKLEQFLWRERMDIWATRKLLSHDKSSNIANDFREILDLLGSVTDKVIQGKAGKDASDLWKIFSVIFDMVGIISTHHQMDALKNPIDDMPEQFKDLVKLAADNKFEVLDIAEEILDSLSTQVVSYEDIIKKLCGDKKRQNCSFCGVKIEVTENFEISKKCSSVLFNILHIRMFSCGSPDCHTKASSREDDSFKLMVAVATAYNERKGSRCDFCFQLCPIDKAHRCCICLTVIYCSKSCHKKDQEEHKRRYCIEDERKTKEDRSTRRQLGEISRGRTAAGRNDVTAVNILNDTLEAFKFEESKIKKGDEDNLDTGREHDSSIPAAAAVPTAGDDGSKSGTAAANTEHVNDRSTPGADTDHTHGGSAYGAGAENDISEVD